MLVIYQIARPLLAKESVCSRFSPQLPILLHVSFVCDLRRIHSKPEFMKPLPPLPIPFSSPPPLPVHHQPECDAEGQDERYWYMPLMRVKFQPYYLGTSTTCLSRRVILIIVQSQQPYIYRITHKHSTEVAVFNKIQFFQLIDLFWSKKDEQNWKMTSTFGTELSRFF